MASLIGTKKGRKYLSCPARLVSTASPASSSRSITARRSGCSKGYGSLLREEEPGTDPSPADRGQGAWRLGCALAPGREAPARRGRRSARPGVATPASYPTPGRLVPGSSRPSTRPSPCTASEPVRDLVPGERPLAPPAGPGHRAQLNRQCFRDHMDAVEPEPIERIRRNLLGRLEEITGLGAGPAGGRPRRLRQAGAAQHQAPEGHRSRQPLRGQERTFRMTSPRPCTRPRNGRP